MKKYLITYFKKDNGYDEVKTIITDLSPEDWLENERGEIDKVLRSGQMYLGAAPAILYIKEVSQEAKTTKELNAERYSGKNC